jgi:hypothetical protein
MTEPTTLYEGKSVFVTHDFLRVGRARYPIRAVSRFVATEIWTTSERIFRLAKVLFGLAVAIAGILLVLAALGNPELGQAYSISGWVALAVGLLIAFAPFGPLRTALVVTMDSGERVEIEAKDLAGAEKIAAALEQALVLRG